MKLMPDDALRIECQSMTGGQEHVTGNQPADNREPGTCERSAKWDIFHFPEENVAQGTGKRLQQLKKVLHLLHSNVRAPASEYEANA